MKSIFVFAVIFAFPLNLLAVGEQPSSRSNPSGTCYEYSDCRGNTLRVRFRSMCTVNYSSFLQDNDPYGPYSCESL